MPLPSRVGAITTIVIGVVVTTVVSVAVFIGVAFTGVNFQRLLDSASPVTSGDTVSVDASGTFMVTDSGGSAIACSLTGGDGTSHALEAAPGQSSVVMGTGIPEGSYTLTCTEAGSGTLVAMTGVSASELTSSVGRAMAFGGLTGFVGVVVTVMGIVWLVRVNGRRREAQRQAWMGPTPRY